MQGAIIKVASTSGLAAGDLIVIGTGTTQETRVIRFVGTAGAGGTGIVLTMPLSFSHSSGATVGDTGPTSKLRAPDGSPLSSLRPPAGDGKSGVFAGGGSGGVGDFAFPDAELSGSPSVSATIAAKTLDARGDVELTAISAFEV